MWKKHYIRRAAFVPYTEDQAKEWLEEHGSAEEYIEEFGEPEE